MRDAQKSPRVRGAPNQIRAGCYLGLLVAVRCEFRVESGDAAGVPCLRRFAVPRAGRVLLFAAEDALHGRLDQGSIRRPLPYTFDGSGDRSGGAGCRRTRTERVTAVAQIFLV